MSGGDTTPEFGWNENAKRYVDLRSGKFVSASKIRSALDDVITAARTEITDISRRLVDGTLSLAEWQVRMAQTIKLLNTASAMLARGGWAQMTPADYGKLGAEIKRQYQYLRKFTREIESGKQKLNGTLVQRANLYGDAARCVYEEVRRFDARDVFAMERRTLGVAEHCEDCISEASRGWQPLGALRRIGDSQCRTHCRCTFEFK